MTDTQGIARYGAGQLEGQYYLVRDADPMTGTEHVAGYFIDGLGDYERISIGRPGAFTPEQIAKMPMLSEAIALHLEPAYEQAEANLRKWEERRTDEPDPEPPPPFDPAAMRFKDDSTAVELPPDSESNWRRWG